jgi:hypothetical protein
MAVDVTNDGRLSEPMTLQMRDDFVVNAWSLSRSRSVSDFR